MEREKIVFFPTNNTGKFERYKNAFEKAGIGYNRYLQNQNGESIKVEVQEDGKTTRENAEKKAKTYYEKYKALLADEEFAIITTDEALYIEGLPDNEQPGLFVRRFQGLNGSRATDEKVVERYTSFVTKMGGQTKAKWKYSFVMYDGESFYDLEWEEPVLFSDKPNMPITKGYPLNNITIIGEDENGKEIMLSDLTEEERNKYLSPYTDKVAKFVNDNMLSEKERI